MTPPHPHPPYTCAVKCVAIAHMHADTLEVTHVLLQPHTTTSLRTSFAFHTSSARKLVATGRHIKYMPMPSAFVWDLLFHERLREKTTAVIEFVARIANKSTAFSAGVLLDDVIQLHNVSPDHSRALIKTRPKIANPLVVLRWALLRLLHLCLPSPCVRT